jgi:hypothetical protein
VFALSLDFAPVDVEALADEDSCLRVSAWRSNPDNKEQCHYDTAVVWEYENGVVVPILIARNDPTVPLPAIDAGSQLAGFEPELMMADLCDCSESLGECCYGVGPGPATYEFGVGLPNPVEIGMKATLVFDGRDYEFWGHDAFDTGVCNEPRRVSWTLARVP